MKLSENILYRIMLGIIIFMFINMGYTYYLTFYPFKTVVINSVTVLTPDVPVGGIFVYKVDYCRYTQAPAIAYKTFYNVHDPEKVYPLGAMEGVGETGCHVAERSLKTDGMPPGEYYLKTITVFTVNKEQTSKIQFITPNFTIK